jgi:hypothetical protein
MISPFELRRCDAGYVKVIKPFAAGGFSGLVVSVCHAVRCAGRGAKEIETSGDVPILIFCVLVKPFTDVTVTADAFAVVVPGAPV